MKNKKQKSHSCNYNKFLEEYKKLSKEELIKTDITTERIEMILLGRGLFILYSYISHCSFFINSS